MSTSQIERSAKFRALHEGPGAFVIPNPWDAGSARILAALGFQALATTSAGFAFSLGYLDGETSRDENMDHCRAIVECCDLPVSADLGNCFGDDPGTVAETIQLAAETGLAGASVEDFTGNQDDPIYEHSLAVERVAAAAEVVRALPFPFMLTARAENYLHGRRDLDDTIRRLKAFSAAGADVLYAPGLADLDSVRAVCAAVAPKPVNVLALPHFTVAGLAEAGARRISVGSALARAALGALIRAGQEMHDQGTFNYAKDAAQTADVNRLLS
jgi:2-methylisocitrate lyase-like PEP mutase family enzyme